MRSVRGGASDAAAAEDAGWTVEQLCQRETERQVLRCEALAALARRRLRGDACARLPAPPALPRLRAASGLLEAALRVRLRIGREQELLMVGMVLWGHGVRACVRA